MLHLGQTSGLKLIQRKILACQDKKYFLEKFLVLKEAKEDFKKEEICLAYKP
jgi:hypothetical protein